MRVLCPNLDREDALENVLDVPIPEEMFTRMGSTAGLRWQNMATWMRAQTLDKWSCPVIANRYNELSFLLYMVGCPLLPLRIQLEDPSANSIRNSSIVSIIKNCFTFNVFYVFNPLISIYLVQTSFYMITLVRRPLMESCEFTAKRYHDNIHYLGHKCKIFF